MLFNAKFLNSMDFPKLILHRNLAKLHFMWHLQCTCSLHIPNINSMQLLSLIIKAQPPCWLYDTLCMVHHHMQVATAT